ncbi:hypothetical protein GCM10022225_06200 [Plantactinospora mayteni]|uniref:Thioredoxin domain-containing protein n=1 Tax=Plantactinospora mayteni TaxID=566021 RepID=A0ABQ4ER76_9ACTN|nr:hypothetical protein [Plantactinospora mayteni]GIG97110.1 hypothetical protein Pma05_36830 [Plantactinospora mayteni]
MSVAVVVLCIVVTLLNLILTLGVIRRLRNHSEQLLSISMAVPRPQPLIAVGKRPSPFRATTVDGAQVNEADLARDGAMAGFFSTTCSSCAEWLPRFVEAARALPAGPRHVLAVVVAEKAADAADMVEQLRGIAMVVVEERKGPVGEAFEVTGYPAMCRLDEHGAVVTTRPADVVAVPVAA